MMGLTPNFCVICLSGLTPTPPAPGNGSGGRNDNAKPVPVDKEKRSTTIKFLLQNLLTTRAKTYDQVLKDVLKLARVIEDVGGATPAPPGRSEVKTEIEDKDTDELDLESPGGDGGNMGGCSDSEDKRLHICDNCEATAGRILELLRKLEALQLRLRREVKAVKETILRGSGWLGGVNGGPEALDNFSRRFWNGKDGEGQWSPKQKAKEAFEILKAFQTAVSEADYDPLLDLPININHLGSPLPVTSEDPHSYLGQGLVVKTEIPDPEEDTGSLQDGSLDLGDFLDEYVDNSGFSYPKDANATIFSDPGSRALSEGTAKRLGSNVKTETGDEVQPTATPSRSTKRSLVRTRSKVKRLYTAHRRSKSKLETKKPKIEPELNDVISSPSKPPSRTRTITTSKKMKPAPKKSKKGKPFPGRSDAPPLTDTPTVQRVGKMLICDSCGVKSKYTSTFEQHLRGHETEQKTFHCPTPNCNQSFTTKQFSNFHEDQHNGHHKMPCDICRLSLSIFDLPDHIRTHVETVFLCAQCSRSFSCLESQLTHLRKQHYGKDLKCWVCGALYQKKEHLLKHLHEVHGAASKLKCEAEGCGRSFVNQVSLDRHKNIHTDRFTCGICCKQFTSLAILQTHQRLRIDADADTDRKPFKCDQCPESFKSKVGLDNHMVRKHGAEKYKCEIESCAKEFGCYEGLYNHKRMEHSDFVKFCPVCNKKCASEYKLKYHMEQHSTEKKYMCDVCGKSFNTSNNCNQHKRMHTEPKFQCQYCPKAFTKSQYLTHHLRTHTGEKPYSCERCGKAFSQRGSVLVHQRKCQPPSLPNPNESRPAHAYAGIGGS